MLRRTLLGLKTKKPLTHPICVFCAFSWLILSPLATHAVEQTVLVDFARDADKLTLEADAGIAKFASNSLGQAIHLAGNGTGERARVLIRPKTGVWDCSRFPFLSAEIRNVGTVTADVSWAALSPNAPGETGVRQSFHRENLAPGETIRFQLRLRHAQGHDAQGNPVKVFAMRTTPYGRAAEGNTAEADPARIDCFRVFIDSGSKNAAIEIANISGLGTTVFSTQNHAPFFPFIDRYGQYLHEDWPDKIHTDADLIRLREQEAKDLAAARRPDDWDSWGGWKNGPTLKATGHFRVEKYEGKWWLVDPDGKLYFSYGVATVRCGDEMNSTTCTPIARRENWFQDLPAQNDPVFGPFFGHIVSGIPEYQKIQDGPLCYNFGGANMRRKYGEHFVEEALALAHRRVAAWNFNSIGGWSDPRLMLQRKIPYAFVIPGGGSLPVPGGRNIKTAKTRSHAKVDELPADFAAKMREAVAKGIAGTENDPWCIGYFVGNEMPWDKANVSDAFCDAYFRTVREAIKAAAPNKLYLGCRFNTWTAAPARAAARHCDIVSFNIYRWPGQAGRFQIPGGADAPMLIGEWHFGTLDHGMFDPGMKCVLNQAERAENFTAYMQAVLAHPQFVGAHWFCYKNHPTTGRALDAANAHNGLIDLCDTPYREVIAAAQNVGKNLYRLREKTK